MSKSSFKIALEATGPVPQRLRSRHYDLVALPALKKQIVVALAESGKANVIWTKRNEIYGDVRQIIKIDGKKYMCFFDKNKLKDVLLLVEGTKCQV